MPDKRGTDNRGSTVMQKVFRNLAGSHLHVARKPFCNVSAIVHSILAKAFTHRNKLHQRFCKRSCRKNLIVYFGPKAALTYRFDT